MDEPSKYTVAVYELINQQGDKLPLQRGCVTEEIAESDCNEPIRIHQK